MIVEQDNKISRRTEYRGHLLELVKALIDIPSGGQIILDGKAFQGISSALVEIYEKIASSFRGGRLR